jgi:hypothetical protein
MKMNMEEHTKHLLDTVSGVTALGAVMKFLPAIAAVLSIVWYCIRIFEWARSKFKK